MQRVQGPVAVLHVQGYLGVAAGKLGKHLGQYMFTQYLRHGEADPALCTAAERGQFVGGITLHIQQAFGVWQQALAGFGQGHGIGVAVEQFAPGVVFQGLYRAGDRTG
ncbi:hypothetical protein D3C72_1915770 [compost metagenome]